MLELSLEHIAALHRESLPCTCDGSGYCQAHGTYTPRVEDQEIVSEFLRSTQRPFDGRVIRKSLDR